MVNPRMPHTGCWKPFWMVGLPGDLAGSLWHLGMFMCFICRQETQVGVVVSQSCLPSGGLIQRLLLASKNLQSHLWEHPEAEVSEQRQKEGQCWYPAGGTGTAPRAE